MSYRRFVDRESRRCAPYRTQVRSNLSTFMERDQRAFKAWLAEYVKDSNHPNLTDDIPSSQIPSKESHIKQDTAQLFAVIDTCSLVRFRSQFMGFITELRRSYKEQVCPVKFIMPIVVLEELDKCNRPIKRSSQQSSVNGVNSRHPQASIKTEPNASDATCATASLATKSAELETPGASREIPIADLLQKDAPPRSFMRFIDTEMRAGLIVGELDPYKTQKLPPMEIVTHDDRILESSIRAKMFVDNRPHHPDTRVVLVTEDNNFKSKATTFEVASFRWREFEAKYRNFGRRHCVSTPLANKLDHAYNQPTRAEPVRLPLTSHPENGATPLLTSWTQHKEAARGHANAVYPEETASVAGATINAFTKTRVVTLDGQSQPTKRSTSIRIKALRAALASEEDIEIIREVYLTTTSQLVRAL